MQRPSAGRPGATVRGGVIDALSAGFGTVNRQLWILLIPLAVDFFLLFGPQVSLSPIVDPLLLRGSDWARRTVLLSPDHNAVLVADIERTRLNLVAEVQNVNALSMLARGPLAVPTIAVEVGGVGALNFVRGWSDGLLLVGSSLAASFLLGALFRAAIAEQVRGTGGGLWAAARAAPRQAARSVGYLLAVVGLGVLLGGPLLLLVGFAALIAPAVATLGLLASLGAALLVAIYLWFALDAIFVVNAGPLAAIQESVAVARQNLWSTLGLVTLTLVIAAGMSVVWGLLAQRLQPPVGLTLGVLGNAYIGSGLVAASMIFYRERAVLGLGDQPRVARSSGSE